MKKFLMACAMTALATGVVTGCGDDDGDDDTNPTAGKGGTAGTSGASGKGGTSSGGISGSGGGKAGAGNGGKGGTSGGNGGRAGGGSGSGGAGRGGAGSGGTDAGGEAGLGGEAGGGSGGQGGEAGLGGGEGGVAGLAGAGGEAGVPGPIAGQGGEGATSAGGQGGAGGEGGSTVPPPVARLRLNEINPSIAGGEDLIELLVVEAGSIEGIIIQQSVGTPATVATLPALTVAVNDLVVVHLNPANGAQAITNETTSKSQCTSTDCYDAAWDVRGASVANGLAVGNRVVTVLSGSTLQDAVPFVVDGGSSAGFLDELQEIQTAGQWSPTSCGGDPCTYDSDPTAIEVSVNWADTEMTEAGDSMQVTASNNNTTGAWDLAASTFGEPNE
jgi:hypothetical protein